MSKFTWSREECDNKIYHGSTVLIVGDSNGDSIQKFVEDVSEAIGKKLDWNTCAGRYVIKTAKEDAEDVFKYIAELSKEDLAKYGITNYM